MTFDWAAMLPPEAAPLPPEAAPLPVGAPTQCYYCHKSAKRAALQQPSACDEHALLVRQIGAHERSAR